MAGFAPVFVTRYRPRMVKPVYEVAAVPGDGIGPEVVGTALSVILQAAAQAGVTLRVTEHPAGVFHFRDAGEALPAATLDAISEADAILFGAAGWPGIRTADGTEIAAGVGGGLGLAPSADLGGDVGVFQPSHGTAPDIAGRGLANPVAAILSGAMLLDWLADRHGDAGCRAAAATIEAAVGTVLATGPRTRDLGGSAGTREVTDAIVAALPA